jgi:hypothetical protein
MSTRKSLDAYRAAIAEVVADFGLTTFRFDSSGKHMKCFFLLPDGSERFTSFSKTPSDGHSIQNHKRDVRRMLLAAGLKPLKTKKEAA